jgi:hypothetical protein
MSIVLNATTFNRGLDKEVVKFNKAFATKIRRIVTEGHRRLIAKTPVHTGQAVANYIASKGAPFSGSAVEAGKAIEATNKLSLGSEALRGGATRRAQGTLDTLDFKNPFDTYWIVNRAPHIGGLEAGELPEEPFVPRSPLGMFAITLQELNALLSTGRI